MSDIVLPIYECGDFSKVGHIGVICRGISLGQIGKYKDHFVNCFVVGQHLRSFNMIGQHLRGSNIVRISGTILLKLNKSYIRMYHEYGIKDIQTSLSVRKSPRKANRFNKMKQIHEPHMVTTHCLPDNFDSRNMRFMHKLGRKKLSHPTSGLFGVNMAAAFKPKILSIIGLDFYQAAYLSKEDVHVSIRSNRARGKDMIEYLKHLCLNEKDIKFILYTCCKQIKSYRNLKVVRV